jgi:hypothetical protein
MNRKSGNAFATAEGEGSLPALLPRGGLPAPTFAVHCSVCDRVLHVMLAGKGSGAIVKCTSCGALQHRRV